MKLTPAIENIEFTKGNDIVFPFGVDDCSTGAAVAVNISAWTITCTAEKMDGTVISEITVTADTDYRVIIKIPRTQTADDDRHGASYRIDCIDTDDNKRTYFKGSLIQTDA